MQTILTKLASRKLWGALLVAALAAVSAWQGVVAWPDALAIIKGALLFYVGVEASLDLAGILRSLAVAWWENRLRAGVEDRLGDLLGRPPAAPGIDYGPGGIDGLRQRLLDAWPREELRRYIEARDAGT